MDKKVSACPGKILEEKFLKPMSLSLQRVAGDINVPETLIDGIIKGKEVISADTALRLGKYLGNGPEFWLTLQMKYDISVAEESLREGLDAIPELSDVPDVSLKEALNPQTEQLLLEQNNMNKVIEELDQLLLDQWHQKEHGKLQQILD
jgi:addiction module HigA family antidote